jgi:hypothetical protein
MSGKEERWRWLSVWLYRRWLDDRSKRAEEMTMPDGAKLPQDVKPRGEYRTMRGNDVIKAVEGVEQRRKQKQYIKLKCAAACKNKACHGEPLRRCMQRLLTSGALTATGDHAAAQQGAPDAEGLGNDESSELEMTAEEEDEYDRAREQSEARVASVNLAQGGGTSAITLEEAAVDDATVGVRDDGDGGQEVQVEKKRKRRYSGDRLRKIKLQRST